MKIVVFAIGIRGDMEPFLAIGELLQAKGHQVTCAFPEQFRDLVEESSLGFASLGSACIEMLESDTGQDAIGRVGHKYGWIDGCQIAEINSIERRVGCQ